MEPNEKLHSFPYEATIAGKDHHYRITQAREKYGIEQDGVLIAEVTHAGEWQQISGMPLDKELLHSICQHIEAKHF